MATENVYESIAMIGRIQSTVRAALKNLVYSDRASIAAGCKRRGDFGFIPRKPSHETVFLKSLNLNGKNVYDIGGNIGLTALYFAKAVGQSGTVTVFEPNPVNVARIEDHLALNGMKNVRVVAVAIGSRKDKLDFVVNQERSATGTLEPPKQKQLSGQSFKVQVNSLDAIIEECRLPAPDFIKMDIEGHELEALKGMHETIIRYKPALHVELHGIKEHDVVQILFAHGYKILQVEEMVEIRPDQLDRVHGHLYMN